MRRRGGRRGRRAVYIVLAVVLGLPAGGALYQAVSVWRESTRFPPAGRMIDIGERRLHLVCIGSGEPTVIFEPSGFGGALSSRAAREEVAAHTRVCSYDRMGMGWSDPGPEVISAGMLARDLERLLENARLQPPYVFVPASMGGLTVELFARRHPDQVSGLVFVDAGHSGALDRFAPRLTPAITTQVCLARMAARFGLLRLWDPLGLRRQPSEAAETIAAVYRVEPVATLCGLVRGIPTTLEDFKEAPQLGPDVPLVVLTAESIAGMVPPGYEDRTAGLARAWVESQQQLSQRSSRGTWRMVPGSDHLIGNSQPHAVATAVLEIVAARRTSSLNKR